MTLLDFSYILQWWILFAVISAIFLPLTILIFHNYFDKGYIFSKILGTVLISYSIWILSSLKLLPFQTGNIIFILIVFSLINVYLLYKQRLLSTFQRKWKIFLFEEILFFLGLTFWSFIRAHEPSIHGLEKFMDFGFINSISRSEYFPPKDLWLSGENINYYYFGHLYTALLTKISFLDPKVTYNLMVATLFGLTFTCSFSIGTNLWYFFTRKRHPELISGSFVEMPDQVRNDGKSYKIFIAGLLAAILVSFAGNLHSIYSLFENYSTESPVPFWQLKPDFNFSGYWYPNATRFIPLTIHEFPIYSFVVSDLHGHALDIPIVLFTIALLICIYFNEKVRSMYFILFGFLIGLMLMTNVLDGPIYLLLISLVLLFKYKLKSIKLVLLVTFLSVLFSLPFWLNFKPFGQGIGVLCSPQFLVEIGKLGSFLFEANHCSRSPFWMLTILYGFFYIIFYGYYAKIRKQISPSDNLALIFTLFATLLILIPELFYIKDIYPAHYRANTVFKFGFQAFIVLSLVSSFMVIRIYHQLKWKLPITLYSLLFIPVLLLVLIYPYFAIRSYYGSLNNYSGLDGLNYLTNQYPTDYTAILWIKNNIKGQGVILEAVGESYTDYARISSNTGLPTVLGWPVHEWLWRGSPDEGTKRSAEIKSIYEEADLMHTQELLNRYNVSYVFIGTLERQKYPNIAEEKFNNLGQIIYDEGSTKIYQLY